MFAAVNTVEPPIFDHSLAGVLDHDKPWYGERARGLEDSIGKRLGDLSARLGETDWLEGAFSAGDLMMISVLRRLNGSDLLEAYPNLAAYVARGEARPAFRRTARHFQAKDQDSLKESLNMTDLMTAAKPKHVLTLERLRTRRWRRSGAAGPSRS